MSNPAQGNVRGASVPQRGKRRLLAGLLGLVCLGSAGGVWAWTQGWLTPPPQIAQPRDRQSLEPDVRTLIDRHLAKVEQAPRSSADHAELGLVYEANDLWAESRAAFLAASQLDPAEPYWRLHLAIVTHQLGDTAAAQEILAGLVQEAPRLAAARHRYGQYLLEEGEIEAAAEHLEAAAELAPQSPYVLASVADLRLRQQKTEEAVRLLREALQYDKTYRVAHFLLGTAYRQLGRMEDAERELELGQKAQVQYVLDKHSQRAQPYSVTARARHGRGVRQMSAGEFAAAKASFEAACKAVPHDVIFLNALAGACMQTGDVERAFELLQQAKQYDADHGTTYVNLASWYAFRGRLDEALANAEEAVRRSRTVSTAHIVRVQVLLAMKRYPQAQQALQEALAILPRDPTLQRMAAQLPK